MAWDVTKAAASHSALAGVLAGFTLAVLAILLTRPQNVLSPAAHTRDADATQQDPDALTQVFKLLILALFLLIVSAIMWGGLSGHPSVESILAEERTAAASSAPKAEGEAAAVIAAFRAGHYAIGAPSVAMLALGALCFVAALAQMIPLGLNFTSTDDLARFARNAFVLLGGLALFEMTYFSTAALELSLRLRLPPPDMIAVVVMATTVVLGFSVRALACRSSRRQQDDAARARALEKMSLKAGVLTAILSVCAYVLVPVTTAASPRYELSRMHAAGSVLGCSSGLLLAAFVLVTVVALELRRSAAQQQHVDVQRRDQAPTAAATHNRAPSRS